MYDHSKGFRGFRTGDGAIFDSVNSLNCLGIR